MSDHNPSALSLPDDAQFDWQQTVETIIADLVANELPDQVIKATEYLIAGMSTYKVAEAVKVKPETVRRWLITYPAMARAVAVGRKNLHVWRMQVLDSQFLDAVAKSQAILDLSFSDETVREKLVAAIGQHARFIISLFLGNKVDINVNLNDNRPLVKAKTDALDYIVTRLKEQREQADIEPIEATYRVLDAQTPTGPLVKEDGQPHHGELGILDTNTDGTLCHVCGNRFDHLGIHIRVKEHLSTEQYEILFLLPPGSIAELNK